VASDALGVAQLDGDDMLQELADGTGVGDIAGESENLRVFREEAAPVVRGGLVPLKGFLRGEDGLAHGCSCQLQVAIYRLSVPKSC